MLKDILVTVLKINWKTTTTGVGMLFAALSPVIIALTDGDPLTHANWEIAVPAVIAAIGFLLAKDGVQLVKK